MTANRAYELRFHEELLLLALRDEKGTVDYRAGMYMYSVAAGMLAELLLAERIAVAEDRKPLVEVVDATPLGDAVVDDCLTRIAGSKRRQQLTTWVARLAMTRGLRDQIALGLVRRGVLRADEDKVLWIFTRKLYPERDSRYERDIIARLRRAIFTDTRTVDPRTAILVSLANGAGLLSIPFDRKGLRERKQRMAEIAAGERMGAAARKAIEAAQAAMMACFAATAACAAASG